MRKIFLLAIAIPILLTFSGCGNKRRTQASSLMNLKLGMTKDQVVNTLGYYPDVHRGSILNKFGQVIDVWEYSVASGGVNIDSVQKAVVATALVVGTFGLLLPALTNEGTVSYYWLIFADNRLVQWGRAGDWEDAKKQIYEIRYR